MGPSGIRRHTLLASGTIALLIAALFVSVLVSVGHVRRAGAESRHHEQTLAALNQVERGLMELSSGLSGYTITARPEFLVHWEHGRGTLGAATERVARLTADDPREAAAIARLRSQIGVYLAIYGRPGILRLVPVTQRARTAGALVARRQVNGALATIGSLRATERAQAERRSADRVRAGDRALWLGGFGLVASVALIAGLGTYVLRRIVAPIRAIIPVADRLGTGERGARVAVSGHAEIRSAGRAFNAMAAEIERQREALESALDELRHQADHDALTGLLNRRALNRELARHNAHVARYGAEGAVLLLDIDGFKDVNDTAGHAAGDAALVRVADLLRSRLRRSDRVGRLGGDEFAVLLPRGDAAAAAVVAETVVQAVREEPGLGLTVSIGVAPFAAEPVAGAGHEAVVAAADRALYAVKAAGRDGYALAAAAPTAPQAASTSAANASTSSGVESQEHIQRTSPDRSSQT